MKRTLGIVVGMTLMSFHSFAQPDPGERAVTPVLKEELEAAKLSKRPLSDAQILGVLEAVNDGEIRLSRLAKSRAQNPQAREFANSMVDHHQQSNDQIQKLSSRLKIRPEKTVWSDELQTDVRISEAELDKGIHPDNKDSAFLNKQVEMHTKVLDRLDNSLIPQAKNEEVRSLLQNTRSQISQHLSQARSVQNQIAGRTAQNER